MVIFAVAALAGFLLFGWIESTERPREFFNNPRTRCKLGLLALAVALVALMFPVVEEIIKSMFAGVNQIIEWMFPGGEIEAIQWPEYWVAIIAQRLTGTEAARLILGAVFGCLLRYWGPHFLEMRLRPWTRYNWVAISLVGLLLLAAAAPYLERQLGGMTGLKTPFAEFQFAGKTNADRVAFEVESESRDITLLPAFAQTKIGKDLAYMRRCKDAAETIAEPCDKEIEEGLEETYDSSQVFIKNFLYPLAMCAFWADEGGLDPESIRHALSPVAQQLRLVILPSGQPGSSTTAEKLSVDELLTKIKKSVKGLKEAFVQDQDLLFQAIEKVEKSVKGLKEALARDKDPLFQEVEKVEKSVKGLKNMCLLGNLESLPTPEVLANTPHIYLVLARMDRYNGNLDKAISTLKSAPTIFGADHKHSPWVSWLISFYLATYLDEGEYTAEDIFPYIDKALEIAQNTRGRIEQFENLDRNLDKEGELRDAKKNFEDYERWAKNALAYFSARTGVRKFMAFRYAEENYDDLDKLSQWMKPDVIDTYGYVKMAFGARKVPPDFDEIEQAKALFQEALARLEILPEYRRYFRQSKHETKKRFRVHLKQADRLLASR